MPHYPALHCAKVALLFTHAVEPVACENTFHVMDATDTIFGDFAGFAAQVYGAALAHLLGALDPAVVLSGVALEDIRTVPYGGADFILGPDAGTGGASGHPLPTDSCICVKRSTAKLGRSYRGRWYWPVWDAGDLASADHVNTVYADTVAGSLAAFQAAVEAGTYPCEVGTVSFQHGGVVTNPGEFNRTTAWTLTDYFVDSQRRRLLGRGR